MIEIEKLARKIASRFREVREFREMKVWGAAIQIGISPRRLKRIEENKSQITLNILFKAAKAYKVEPDVLLCRKDIPRDKSGGRKIKARISLTAQPATS